MSVRFYVDVTPLRGFLFLGSELIRFVKVKTIILDKNYNDAI